jgi:hypothetical protein
VVTSDDAALIRAMAKMMTPEMVTIFVRCEQIIEDGHDELWEDQGGRRREFLDANEALRKLLGRNIAQVSPVDADDPLPPAYNREAVHDYGGAHRLRLALLKAAKKG